MSSSNPEESSPPPSLEELSTRGATALLLPLIMGMVSAANYPPGEVEVFIDQTTRTITLVEGSLDVESFLGEIPTKEGPLPATKASIEALPRVRVSEAGMECAICLAECEVNVNDDESEVKEMPCRHRFHSDCIEKWLGIHGSCPICRFSMPVEERKEVEEGDWSFHLFLTTARRDTDTDMDMDIDIDDGDRNSDDVETGEDDDDDDDDGDDEEEEDMDIGETD